MTTTKAKFSPEDLQILLPLLDMVHLYNNTLISVKEKYDSEVTKALDRMNLRKHSPGIKRSINIDAIKNEIIIIDEPEIIIPGPKHDKQN